MELFGRKIGFKLTVGAACEIAEKCPGGELRNVPALIESGDVADKMFFICALSRGYEEARSFEEPGHKPMPLTPEQLRAAELKSFNAAFDEACAAFLAGLKTSVEVAKAKKNGDAGAKASP